MNARSIVRGKMGKTAQGSRFGESSNSKERPVYNETTISFPRANDSYSIYSKTPQKPQRAIATEQRVEKKQVTF